MRIVHVINYFQPQLGYQETYLPREQAKMGHEVYVVTSDRYSPLIYQANRELIGNRIVGGGFFVEEGVRVWRLKTLFEIQFQTWMIGLEKKIQELNPDVVIMHGVVSFTAIRIARLKKRLGNFKLIYDDHMTPDLSTSKLKVLYPFFKQTFSHLIQKAADAFVAVGEPSRIFMHKSYGIPLNRITVIPLGADDGLFKPDALARRQIRSKLCLNDADVVFIYTGKIIPQKRLHILIEALTLITDHQGLKVLLVGNGSETYMKELREAIRDKNLEGKFIWHDMVPNKELYRYYSAADVAVWPAGASISMLEGMACNLPIIVSDSPNINEMTYVGNQLTYQRYDPSELAQQMQKLLEPQFRREMGARSRKMIEESLNWRVIARQFIELVEKAGQ